MSILSLTPSTRLGLALARDIRDDAFDAFLSSLEADPDSTPAVSSISSEDGSRLMEAIEAMYAVREYNEVPLEEFVSDLVESFKFNKELDSSREVIFRERLTRLLGITALRISAKASLLLAEHERTFCTARILTDIRPVYENGVKGAPSAAIITHTLKLSYHDADGELRDFYLTLGSDDLSTLYQVLDRASDKTSSLRAVLDSAKVRCIDPQQ